MLAHLLLAAALTAPVTAPALDPQTPPSETTSVSQPLSPAMEVAEANVARVKENAKVKNWQDPDYPESEKAAGNGGVVYVKGIVGLDGHYEEVAIDRSSAGPTLTASALSTAKKLEFVPAKDAAGNAIAVPKFLSFVFETEAISRSIISNVEAQYSAAMRAAGIHGKVTVEGNIGADGRLEGAKVTVSSHSTELDQASLDAAQASRFRAFVDGNGDSVPRPLQIQNEFFQFTDHKNGDLTQYSCGQFVRDQTWWSANWPSDQKDYLYSVLRGMDAASQIVFSPGKPLQDFDDKWDRAIEACKQKPKSYFVKVFND